MTEQKPSWYENKAAVILWLFLFFPVGLYGIWKSSHFSEKTRWIVTGCIAVLGVIVVVTDDKDRRRVKAPNQTISSQTTKTGMQPCGEASTQTGQVLKVTGNGFTPIRTGPGENFDKIVNQKATDSVGKTQFKNIDDSVTVYEECTQSGWSKIGITEPDWLRESHKGWVPSRLLAPGR